MTSRRRAGVKNTWFKEWFTPHESHSHRVRRTLVRARTAFQTATVADTYSFGRCLVLDGEMQSAQLDEFIYHECLVHPALLSHANPRRVLILGGGEGATVREILKHTSVEKIVMVDIDGDVVDFCKKYLTSWHQGAFDDSRLELIVADAKAYVENGGDAFDVIISDLPSPVEAGPAYGLYTLEFYWNLKKRLSPGGVFVMQAGSGHLLQLELHQVLFSTLRRVFKYVRPFYAHIPSFDVPWAFLIGSDRRDPLALTRPIAERLIRKRMRGPLSFYDSITHVGLFHVPKHLRDRLNSERRAITKSKPVYFYK